MNKKSQNKFIKFLFISIVISLAILGSIFFNSKIAQAGSDFSGGDGSVENPYQLANCEQLQLVGSYLDSSFILKNNIDCSDSKTWNDYYDINGLYTVDYYYPSSGATEINLDVKSLIVDRIFTSSSYNLLGPSEYSVDYENGIVNFNNPLNYNVVRIDYSYAIGFTPIADNENPFSANFDGAGYTISNLYIKNYSNFIALFSAVSGNIKNLNLENVFVQGYDRTASLTARLLDGGNIENINASGEVNGYDYVGGLVAGSFSSISNANFSGVVRGSSYVGGLIGGVSALSEDNPSIISDSSSSANVYATGIEGVGGLIGVTDTYTEILNSFSVSNVTGYWTIGSLVGIAKGIINNSYSSGTVTSLGGYGVGGLVGYLEFGKINRSYSSSEVNANMDDFSFPINTSYAGGLVGVSDGGEILESYASGNVSATGARVGALVGGSNSLIKDCYATGNIESKSGDVFSDDNIRVSALVGGLAHPGKIENSYSTGEVSGKAFVGGLLGYSDNGDVINSFTTSRVNASNNYAALVGSYNSSGVSLVGGAWYNAHDYPGDFSCYMHDNGTTFIRGDQNCQSISEEIGLNYFYNSQNYPMLDNWDFDNIWQKNKNNLPTLKRVVGAIAPEDDDEEGEDEESEEPENTENNNNFIASSPVLLPGSVGDGLLDFISRNIGDTLDAGIINNFGVNFLTYTTNRNNFLIGQSSDNWGLAPHHFIIEDIDLYRNIAYLVFYSEPQKIILNKGESKELDLDQDNINDIKIIFTDLYINRAEITIKSLSGNKINIPEKNISENIEIKNDQMYQKLKGKIILKTEDDGRAYYISPDKQEMYYLGRPADAFRVMREQGIGITNNDLNKILISGEKNNKDIILSFAKNNSGKIFIQTQNNGEAWYVDTLNNSRHYLGRPADAFQIMRFLSLGISNFDFDNFYKE